MKIRKIRKRVLSLALALLIMVALMPSQAFAASKYCCVSTCNKTVKHSHSRNQSSAKTKKSSRTAKKCKVANCTKTGSHTHRKTAAAKRSKHTAKSRHAGRHH